MWTRGEPLVEPTHPASSMGAGGAWAPGAEQLCHAGAAALARVLRVVRGWAGWHRGEGGWCILKAEP